MDPEQEKDIPKKPFFTEQRIDLIIKIFRYLYVVLAIIMLLNILMGVLEKNAETIVTGLINLLFTTSIFWGLYKRKPWVLPLIWIYCVLWVTNYFFSSHSAIDILLMISVIFQIYFFTLKAVKTYFSLKTTTIF